MAECKEIEANNPRDLKARLSKECDRLEKYFHPEKYPMGEEKFEENKEFYFDHNVKLNGDRNYKLRVYVNSRYPQSLPDLVVCESPELMPINDPNWRGSHETHTWPPKCGFLRICHWRWAAWISENIEEEMMLYHVFKKGEEWLEAYEKYLVTKKPKLDLEEMNLTEEEKKIEQKCQLIKLSKDADVLMSQLHPTFRMTIFCWLETRNNMQMSQMSSAITDEKITNTYRRMLHDESAVQRVDEDLDDIMLAEWSKLQCAIVQHKAVWPTWLLVLLKFLTDKQNRIMMENFNVRSIQSC